MKKNNTQGFTLLELLVVIAIIAILATILILVINPVETLKRARDVQRLSDLSTLKTSIALYMINSSDFNSAGLDGVGNARCKDIAGGSWPTGGSIYYSYRTTGTIGDTPNLGQTARVSSNPGLVTGDGWIPINLGSLAGSSPISNLPVDPTNSIANTNSLASSDLVYRYACGVNPTSFEINARLESITYTSDDNYQKSDGGDNDGLYEIGTHLRILNERADF